MLTGPKLKILQELAASATRDELAWISGYVNGMLANEPAATADLQTETAPVAEATANVGNAMKKMTVVYGTETGNAKKLATDLAVRARKKNVMVKLASLDQYRLTDITKEENLFVVISTQGDGEPPAAAQKFYDHIHRNGFRLDKLKYSVLALGDTAYPMFCKTGEDVDNQLQQLGGQRLIPVTKCDLDYEPIAERWFADVLQVIETNASPAAKLIPAERPAPTTAKAARKIYKGELIAHVNLHDRPGRETYHLEIALPETVDYQPGDSVGIVPENSPQAVQTVLELAGVKGDESLRHKDTMGTASELLQTKLNISHLHERVVKQYAAISGYEIPATRMDLADLLRIYPLSSPEQFREVVAALPAQAPRIYTIASSPAAHDSELHLTVERDLFTVNEKQHSGLCTGYLARTKTGAELSFFVQKNKRFKLPAPEHDIIMIGPGTGIAAFRSFLAEREATGATGRNWLFFGEEHFVSDFLYQTEIQNWHETGLLNKVSLAFSGDTPAGIGVHHRLLEQGKEIFDWISNGAHFYVCGQKSPMSNEVEAALLGIIERYSGRSASETAAWFEVWKNNGRYSKDVY
jgi:sulfite reductase (NADPH) flavoprotein alpha-component